MTIICLACYEGDYVITDKYILPKGVEFEKKESFGLIPTEVNALVDYSDILIIDIRPKLEYYTIPGAKHIPFQRLEDAKLPKNKVIILADEDGSLAKRFCEILRAKGYNAFYLKGGLLRYYDEGYPMTKV